MGAAAPTFNGLDQNYDFIYDALLDGATVYLRISQPDGYISNAIVTSWFLVPSYGLILCTTIDGLYQELAFTNGSYHSSGR